jgi:hypothetical protein
LGFWRSGAGAGEVSWLPRHVLRSLGFGRFGIGLAHLGFDVGHSCALRVRQRTASGFA